MCKFTIGGGLFEASFQDFDPPRLLNRHTMLLLVRRATIAYSFKMSAEHHDIGPELELLRRQLAEVEERWIECGLMHVDNPIADSIRQDIEAKESLLASQLITRD